MSHHGSKPKRWRLNSRKYRKRLFKIYTRASGEIPWDMATAQKNTQMVTFTSGILEKESTTELENTFGRMALHTQDNSKMEWSMVKVNGSSKIPILTKRVMIKKRDHLSIRVISIKIANLGLEPWSGAQEDDMMGSFCSIKDTARVKWYGVTAPHTKASGKMGSEMDLVDWRPDSRRT